MNKELNLNLGNHELFSSPLFPFQNGVFWGWMGGFLGRAQDTALKNLTPVESRMLVAELWPYWWWMAAVERDRDQESISQQLRHRGWQLEQLDVRPGVSRHS